MLYVFESIGDLPDDFPERSCPHLSVQRREKVFSYRFLLDRKLSAIAYLLLCLALRENYAIREPVVFVYGKNGKPCLRDYPEIHFNLSHCRSAVACAVSPREIGVDIEEVAPISGDLARRVLTAREYEACKRAENPSRRFCEYWVIKESFLKKSGDGLSAELTSLSADHIDEKTLLTHSEAYCGCVVGDCGSVRWVGASELMFETICEDS